LSFIWEKIQGDEVEVEKLLIVIFKNRMRKNMSLAKRRFSEFNKNKCRFSEFSLKKIKQACCIPHITKLYSIKQFNDESISNYYERFRTIYHVIQHFSGCIGNDPALFVNISFQHMPTINLLTSPEKRMRCSHPILQK